MNGIESTPLEQLVEDFRYDNEAENLSPRTNRWYQDLLRAFLRWLDEEGRPAVLDSLSLPLAVDYVHYLRERPNRHTGNKLSSHATASNDT